jgi:hypothetical protein
MTTENPAGLPSTAFHPDLDWSQVRETVRMINLAVAQIVMAMQDGDESVSELSRSFTDMVERVTDIGGLAAQLDGEHTADVKAGIAANCAAVQGGIEQSIVAFQFYDRLSQRLQHVNHVLSLLSDLVSDHSRLFNPGEWQAMQEAIRSRYTMTEEQMMFDQLLAGASVEAALEAVRERMRSGSISDIEFF